MFNFFLLFCLYLPFQVALNPILGIDLASIRVLILVLLGAWLYISIKNKKKIFIFDIQFKLILIFLFLTSISLFFAQNYVWSLRKLFYLFSIFPLYFIARNLLNKKERRLKVISRLVFSGAVLSFIGIIQFFSQLFWSHEKISNFYLKFIGPTFWGESFTQLVAAHSSWLVNISGRNYFRAISVFPDPHTFSMFLGMLLPLALSLLLFYKKNKLWLGSFLLIFLADILTFSRGAYLGILVGLLLFVFVFWRKISQKNKIIIGVATGLFFLVSAVNPISQRFLSSFNFKEGSNLGRIKIWEKSLEVIKQKPVFGTGIGNFPLEINQDENYRNPIYSHNTYLDIAVEGGILSGVIWILILLITLRKFWFMSKNNLLYIGLTSSLIIFSVHSLVETGIYSPMVLALFLILISYYPQYEK